MAKYYTTTEELTSVADAIRAKTGDSSSLTYPSGFVSAIGSITGAASTGEKTVFYYDYDGTEVASYTAEEFASLSAHPANPTHTGLTAQGWNWSLSDAKTYVAAHGALDIGQMYITSDGKTRLYITINDLNNATIPLSWNQDTKNGITIDWGDNSEVESDNSAGMRGRTHTYSNTGNYVITITSVSGTYYLGDKRAAYTVFSNINTNTYLHNIIQKVELGTGITAIEDYIFYEQYQLTTITIPNTITTIGQYAFRNCYSLKSATLPVEITTIKTYAFENCRSLEHLILSNKITNIENYVCAYCYNLKQIIIPDSVTAIGESVFYDCYSLNKAILSKT